MRSCQPHCVPAKARDGLHAIVQSYLDNNAKGEARYLRFYAIQRTLADAITKSALAELPDGSRFSHQRRIPGPVLAQARDALLELNYRNLRTFADLYELVARAIRPIRGIGLLTIYEPRTASARF